jgi:hypothetical protein
MASADLRILSTRYSQSDMNRKTWGNSGGAMKLGAFKLNAYFNLFVIRGAVNRL